LHILTFIPKFFKAFQIEQVSEGKKLMARIPNGNYTSRETLAPFKENEALLVGGRWVYSSN
jgi:hypothetical protein